VVAAFLFACCKTKEFLIMGAFNLGFTGVHNRVSFAEPAYLQVIDAANRAGVDVNTYAADRAAEARGDAQFVVATAPAVEAAATVELPQATEFAAFSGAAATGHEVVVVQQ
jgi:hypothetical protein